MGPAEAGLSGHTRDRDLYLSFVLSLVLLEKTLRPVVLPFGAAGFAEEVGGALVHDTSPELHLPQNSLRLELRTGQSVYNRYHVVRAAFRARGFFEYGHT
jgi:hypothetical protein